LRPDRVEELEGDVPGGIDGRHVEDVAVSDPEDQAGVLAEVGGFAGRTVVQRGTGQDERAPGDDARESHGLAAHTKR